MKSTKVSSNDRAIVLRADRTVFARMLVMAQSRTMDMRKVLEFDLCPLPLALALPDGSLAKTDKAKLLSLLEAGVPSADCVPQNAARVVDAMALLQALQNIPSTFSQLAELVFSITTSSFQYGIERVDFVVDQYKDISIKGCEQQRRGQTGVLRVQVLRGSQPCPVQWKKFLQNGNNKMELTHFLANEWRGSSYASWLLRRELYVTTSAQCLCLSSRDGLTVSSEEVPQLFSTQEEADTRLILHAAHAAVSHPAVVIQSPDTDVAVLCCFFQDKIAAPLFFRTGNRQRTRFIDIQAVCFSLSLPVCKALLGFHALTGCDSTSAFVGREKALAVELIRTSPSAHSTMEKLGEFF